MGERTVADRLEDLGADVASALEETRARRGGADRVRARLAAGSVTFGHRRSRRPFHVNRGRAAAALVLAAAFALVFAWPRRPATHGTPAAAALSFAIGKDPGVPGGFIASQLAEETPVVFSDGSRITLAPAAHARVAEVDHDGARVLVERGTVHVAVVHRESTRWMVEAGPYEVRVTGTKFDLSWDPAASGLAVRLDEGSVVVRGCGLAAEGRRLAAGETLAVACNPPAPPVTLPTPTPTETATPSTVAPRVVDAPKVDRSREVVAHAERGEHTEALMAAEANGFGATCDTLSASELQLLADSSRYAGRFERAEQAFAAVRRRFPGTDGAANAAFERTIEMDIDHDLRPAGDRFETYLRERPNGGLAREALGRALEARHRSGDEVRAQRLAARYLEAYPEGPHAKLARNIAPSAAGAANPAEGSPR